MIFSGRLAVSPVSYLPPRETALQLLAPLSGVVAWAAAKWAFLPKIVMPLLALAAFGVTRRLFKTSGNFLFIIALFSVLVTAWTAWAALIVVKGGSLPQGGGEVFFPAAGKLLFLPVALLYHWSFRLFGWMTYPLSLFLLAAAFFVFFVKKQSRKEWYLENLLMLYGAGLMLSLLISFLSSEPAASPLTLLLSGILPAGLWAVLFGILLVLTLYFLVSRITGFTLKDLKNRKGSGKRGGSPKPKRPSAKGAGAADDSKTEKGRGKAAEKAAEEQAEEPVKLELNLTPLALAEGESGRADAPESEEPAESGETEQVPTAEEPAEAAEFKTITEETFTKLSLPLVFAETVTGPASFLLSYDVPDGLSLAEVKKQEKEIEFRLSEERGRPLVPIPGKKRVGILYPRSDRENLLFGKVSPLLYGQDGKGRKEVLPIYVGKTLWGGDFIADLADAPHLLVAGSTGSGKSVFLHVLIESLLRGPRSRFTRLVLVDPKRVEFGDFSSSPHLACPIVEEPDETDRLLSTLIETMEDRYRILAGKGYKNIGELYEQEQNPQMPYLVAVLDEVADLFLSERGKELKTSIIKLAQKSRAVGIHLVLATQRPSADIIDGLIKANFPTRIAFRTSSQVDSRVILDRNGAEALFGKGDGLFVSPTDEQPVRFQGAFLES